MLYIINPAFVDFEETSCYLSAQFVQIYSLFFRYRQLANLVRPVSFIKTMDLYDVSLVTINRQTSHNSGIHRQDHIIIRLLAKNHTGFADWVTIWIVHLSVWTLLPHRTRPCGPCKAAISGLDELKLIILVVSGAFIFNQFDKSSFS